MPNQVKIITLWWLIMGSHGCMMPQQIYVRPNQGHIRCHGGIYQYRYMHHYAFITSYTPAKASPCMPVIPIMRYDIPVMRCYISQIMYNSNFQMGKYECNEGVSGFVSDILGLMGAYQIQVYVYQV